MVSTPKEKSIIEQLEIHFERSNKIFQRGKSTISFLNYLVKGSQHYLKNIYGENSDLSRRFLDLKSSVVSPENLSRTVEEQLIVLREVIQDLKSIPKIQKVQGETSRSRTENIKGLGRIFIGHGRNPIWSRLLVYLKDELNFDVEVFESESHTSEHIIDILKEFLDKCDTSVIIMTKDDETTEGKKRSRQNVIHEIGLFQGRLGFDRVILLQETGTEDFSNIHGLQVIRFQNSIEDTFYQLDRTLKKLNVKQSDRDL